MHPITQRIIEGTPRRVRPAVELAIRTVDDSMNDRVPGLSAEIAFFVLLSLPPLMLTVMSAVGVASDLFGTSWRTDVIDLIRDGAAGALSPATVESTIDPLLRAVIHENSGSLFGIGFLLTLVSASRALRVVTTSITIAYDLDETRPGWQQRLWGLGLTVGAILTGVGLIPLLIAGPGFGQTLADWVNGPQLLADVWRFLYWPSAALLMTAMLAVLYHLAAPWWTPWRRDLPGAALAMALWLLGSHGLRVYVGRTIGADAIYQPIAGPIVVLLWLYVSGFVVLLGAELNAEIEKMWPTETTGDDAD